MGDQSFFGCFTSIAFIFVVSVIKDLQSLYDYSRGSAFFKKRYSGSTLICLFSSFELFLFSWELNEGWRRIPIVSNCSTTRAYFLDKLQSRHLAKRSVIWMPLCQSGPPSSIVQHASSTPRTTPHIAIRRGSRSRRSAIIAIRLRSTCSQSPPRST
jgi:hypothetical protein